LQFISLLVKAAPTETIGSGPEPEKTFTSKL